MPRPSGIWLAKENRVSLAIPITTRLVVRHRHQDTPRRVPKIVIEEDPESRRDVIDMNHDSNATVPPVAAPQGDPTSTSTIEGIAAGKEQAKAVLAASGIDLSKATEHVNGTTGGSSKETSPSRKRKRETPVERIQADDYVQHEYYHKSLWAEQQHHPLLLQQKTQEAQFYKSLAPKKHQDPGFIYGYGYENYGNPRTDDRTLRDPIVYPRLRRPGKRTTRPPRVPRKDQAIQAEQDEELVPIRLDIEWGKIKLRDTFTWNLYDHTTSVEYFAEKLVEDFGLDVQSCRPLIVKVISDIREQLMEYCPQVYTKNEPVDPQLPYFAYKNDEMRILIKLNITIGQNTLLDQFEWDINSPYNNPEEFARQMTHEASLAGEFTTAIAHSIREQCQLFSKSLHMTGYPFDGRPVDDPDLKENFLPSPMPVTFRPYQVAKDYTPYLYELNEADLERTELSISREQRRQKRSTNRRGGPALPDLKDRQKTIRSLVVSSVIPGGALSMEESRIFRIPRQTRPRRPGQRDALDDSDESESEGESAPDSPAIPTHLLQQASRTRGTMRSAALTATAGIRSNLSGFTGRSATPESAALHHESRSSARRRDYKEDSDDDTDKFIITLKVGRQRLRDWTKANKAKDKAVPVPHQSSPAPTKPTRPLTAMPLNLAGAPALPPSPPPPFEAVGAVDATHRPPSPGHPAPNPPQWLLDCLANNMRHYPRDRFEGVMKHVAIDPTTQQPVAATDENNHFVHKFLPRIRCLDCPGKLYVTGPGTTTERFEAHLKNRKHREAVEERLGEERARR